MKQWVAKSVFTAIFCIAPGVQAATPVSSDRAAAQAAATTWLAILDSGDYGRAASGVADETLATIHWPKQEDKTAAVLTLLQTDKRKGEFGSNPVVTRTLQPDGVKQVTSCNCGIRDGVFYAFSYNVKDTWDDRRFRVQRHRDVTDVVYMLREPDGSWKPAAITSHFGDYTH